MLKKLYIKENASLPGLRSFPECLQGARANRDSRGAGGGVGGLRGGRGRVLGQLGREIARRGWGPRTAPSGLSPGSVVQPCEEPSGEAVGPQRDLRAGETGCVAGGGLRHPE